MCVYLSCDCDCNCHFLAQTTFSLKDNKVNVIKQEHIKKKPTTHNRVSAAWVASKGFNVNVCLMWACALCPAVVMVCLLRYAQVIEHSHRCWVNTSALASGCTNAVGLLMVGNFQVNWVWTHLPVNENPFFGGDPRTVQTLTGAVCLSDRSIMPNLSTMWVLAWRFQQGCCLCVCSVCSPTGSLSPPLTTGWPTSAWHWHWELWCPSSSVSFQETGCDELVWTNLIMWFLSHFQWKFVNEVHN